MSLGAIKHNLEAIRRRSGAQVMAVVKANAYGHGAIPVARAALEAGAWGLAVSTLAEAQELRGLCPPQRLLVLGGLTPADAAAAVALGCALTCSSHELAAALAAAAPAGGEVPVHVKVDTGLGRLGCRPEDAPALARLVAEAPGLRLAGVYTHLSSSDSDPELTRTQEARYRTVLASLGLDPGLRHVSNSGGARLHPEAKFDLVRAGIALYGCEWPSSEPALALRALVTHVKEVPAGATVGYAATWTAERMTAVATVAIGYADGVLRARSNRGWALVRGARAPLIGRVSMDAVTLDVTGIEGVAVGDTATLVGGDGSDRITAEQVGEWSGTISYEVLTSIGNRVERRYSE